MTESMGKRLKMEALYFREHRKLSRNVKKVEFGEESAVDKFLDYEARLKGLAKIDNSAWDLDPRRGDVAVHSDQMTGRPMVASFEGDLVNGCARIPPGRRLSYRRLLCGRTRSAGCPGDPAQFGRLSGAGMFH